MLRRKGEPVEIVDSSIIATPGRMTKADNRKNQRRFSTILNMLAPQFL